MKLLLTKFSSLFCFSYQNLFKLRFFFYLFAFFLFLWSWSFILKFFFFHLLLLSSYTPSSSCIRCRGECEVSVTCLMSIAVVSFSLTFNLNVIYAIPQNLMKLKQGRKRIEEKQSRLKTKPYLPNYSFL